VDIVIDVQLLGEGGVTTESVRHADLVSFTRLKAFTFKDGPVSVARFQMGRRGA
jgi:hypothetical protein